MSFDYFDADDRDAPQAGDLDQENDDYTIACPSCGRPIHESVPRCPYCGRWVLEDSPVAARARGWFWPIMIAILVAIILVVWHGTR